LSKEERVTNFTLCLRKLQEATATSEIFNLIKKIKFSALSDDILQDVDPSLMVEAAAKILALRENDLLESKVRLPFELSRNT